MSDDDPIRNLIDAAEKMDKWLYQTCRASRFRRLTAHGLPAQELHNALAALHSLSNQKAIFVEGSKISGALFDRLTDEITHNMSGAGIVTSDIDDHEDFGFLPLNPRDDDSK